MDESTRLVAEFVQLIDDLNRHDDLVRELCRSGNASRAALLVAEAVRYLAERETAHHDALACIGNRSF